MGREDAALGCLITLEEPTAPMKAEAKAAGQFKSLSPGDLPSFTQAYMASPLAEYLGRCLS